MRVNPADPLQGVSKRVRARIGDLAEIMLVECRPWDMSLVADLEALWGVTQTTVYKTRESFYQFYASQLQERREEIRAEFVCRVRSAQKAADGSKGLSSLMNLEAKVTGLHEPPPSPADAGVSNEPMTEQEAVGILSTQPLHLLEAALEVARAKSAE